MANLTDPDDESLRRLQWQARSEADGFENKDLKRLQLVLYAVPVFGLIPSLGTLLNRKSDRQHRAASRLCLTFTVSWAVAYMLLNLGVQVASETGGTGLSLLLLNSVLTSGYFLTSCGLMLRLWQNRPLNLPGFSRLAKHLP